MKNNIRWIAVSLITIIGWTGLSVMPAFADDGGDGGSMQNNWNWMGNGSGQNTWNGYGNGWGTLPPQTVTGDVYGTADSTVTVVLSPGWNLVDANVARASHAAITDYWNGYAYQSHAPNPGNGIWIYESAPSTVSLPSSIRSNFSIEVGAGAWAMIGNPFPTAETVALQTGDVAYTYHSAINQYDSAQTGTLTLQPGQGAWLYSASGGTYTIGMAPPTPPTVSN